MKLLSAQQIRAWDKFTIDHTPIASIDLMEKAAKAFTHCFLEKFPDSKSPVYIFCGSGNNGGDGLAIGRLLHYAGRAVHIFQCEIGQHPSADFLKNLDRLPAYDAIPLNTLVPGAPLPTLSASGILIDGLFGTGLNRPIQGYWARLIQHLNKYTGPKVAIDIPSGLLADQTQKGLSFQADHTISFQIPKLAFFWNENADSVGQFEIVNIGLLDEYLEAVETAFEFFDLKLAKTIYQSRSKFGHKGHYGHALLIAGSYGMSGAAQLATKSCLRAGAGLVTTHVPQCAYSILQTSIPEAMCSVDTHEHFFSTLPPLDKFSAIGVGPGLGQAGLTQVAFRRLLEQASSPLVIDADALNLLAMEPELLKRLPQGSILTPHPGEFKRLFGESSNSHQQVYLLQEMAMEYHIYIILKGAHSRIAFPDGRLFFNASGNPGMATAGSGDVLTGILTGLLAGPYDPADTVLLGTFLHGLAGDLAQQNWHTEAMLASDIIQNLGKAFKLIAN